MLGIWALGIKKSKLLTFIYRGFSNEFGSFKVHFSKALKNMRESTGKIPEEKVYQE